MSDKDPIALYRDVAPEEIERALRRARRLRRATLRVLSRRAARALRQAFRRLLPARPDITPAERERQRRDYWELMAYSDAELHDLGIRRVDIPRIVRSRPPVETEAAEGMAGAARA